MLNLEGMETIVSVAKFELYEFESGSGGVELKQNVVRLDHTFLVTGCVSF